MAGKGAKKKEAAAKESRRRTRAAKSNEDGGQDEAPANVPRRSPRRLLRKKRTDDDGTDAGAEISEVRTAPGEEEIPIAAGSEGGRRTAPDGLSGEASPRRSGMRLRGTGEGNEFKPSFSTPIGAPASSTERIASQAELEEEYGKGSALTLNKQEEDPSVALLHSAAPDRIGGTGEKAAAGKTSNLQIGSNSSKPSAAAPFHAPLRDRHVSQADASQTAPRRKGAGGTAGGKRDRPVRSPEPVRTVSNEKMRKNKGKEEARAAKRRNLSSKGAKGSTKEARGDLVPRDLSSELNPSPTLSKDKSPQPAKGSRL